MTVYYDKSENRLVYVQAAATPDFWDAHWESDQLKKLIRRGHSFVVNQTRLFLAEGSWILEGGCGQANSVWGLHNAGFKSIGIDFAENTVSAIKEVAPELDIRLGDVRSLSFEDATFDGYWSLGVIEHFYEGYQQILEEMRRVIKPGGYLFLTVPAMSPLRCLKAGRGAYPAFIPNENNIKAFYQYALDPKRVIRDFEANGFNTISTHGMDGLKGLKDEITILKPILQRLYDGKGKFNACIKKYANKILIPTYHMMYFVMQRQ